MRGDRLRDRDLGQSRHCGTHFEQIGATRQIAQKRAEEHSLPQLAKQKGQRVRVGCSSQRRGIALADADGRFQGCGDRGEKLGPCGAKALRVQAELERLGEVHRRSQCGDRPFPY